MGRYGNTQAPRNTGWSWSSLLRECGGDEERALALLQYQPGLGLFADMGSGGLHGRGAAVAHGVDDPAWRVRGDDIHDEVPYRCEPVMPWFMEPVAFDQILIKSWGSGNRRVISLLLDSTEDVAIIREYDDIIGGAL